MVQTESSKICYPEEVTPPSLFGTDLEDLPTNSVPVSGTMRKPYPQNLLKRQRIDLAILDQISAQDSECQGIEQS